MRDDRRSAPLEVTLCHAPHDGIRPAVLLQLGPKGPQYLFSAPEGFSRLVLEHRIRPSAALAAIFCLRPSSLGGLPGILMRLRDDGHGSVLVCGPEGTEQMLKGLRAFMSWTHPQVTVSEAESASDLPAYEDAHMIVYPLHPQSLAGGSDSAVAYLRHLRQCTDDSSQPPALAPADCQKRKPNTGAGAECNGRQQWADHGDNCLTSQAMQANASQRGSRDCSSFPHAATHNGSSEKATFERLDAIFRSTSPGKRSLKRKVGQILGAKAAGSHIVNSLASPTLESQSEPTQDHSAEQKSASPIAFLCCLRDADTHILALDCQSQDDQAALSRHPAVRELALHPLQQVLCLHLTDVSGSSLSHYQAWAQSLPGMQVLFNSSPDSPADGLGYLAAARSLIRLNTISPALFPLPHALAREAAGADEDIDLPDEDSGDVSGKEPASEQDTHQRMYTAAGVSHAVVHSTSPFSWTKLDSFEPLNFGALKERLLEDHPALGAALKELKGTALSRPWYADSSNAAQPGIVEAALRRDTGQLLFLGTGCAEPSKYRGSSGIHLRFHNGRGLLIDAGEGVHGQLVRHYGPVAAQQQVDRLCAVWVSHKHADHMLGLPGILSARSADQPPLLVVGPAAAGVWLASIAAFMQLRYQYIHCSHFDRLHSPARAWLLSTLGLRRWLSVAVDHCRDAWALVIEHVSGWNLVYSGDTRPCKALSAAGRGCTILIHEATFEPDLVNQAVRKRHSTTAEALMVAEEMHAYRTVLTHFSSRYPKLPVGLPGSGPASEQVLVAYDGMRLPLSLLTAAPKVMGPLVLAFTKEDEQ
ncbi:g3928 [Coccomyxa viridis]|uniref:ribonuclease Z n=1 Tax=Coccomyxa viridis TaxID=1274662 RepID=A0ABP1FUB6_9CHLO